MMPAEGFLAAHVCYVLMVRVIDQLAVLIAGLIASRYVDGFGLVPARIETTCIHGIHTCGSYVLSFLVAGFLVCVNLLFRRLVPAEIPAYKADIPYAYGISPVFPYADGVFQRAGAIGYVKAFTCNVVYNC
jgi:hypothetical protein